MKDFVAVLPRLHRVEPAVQHVRLGPARIRKLFTQAPEKLSAPERRWLEHVLTSSAAVQEAYLLFQEFRAMMAHRQADELIPWLERASRSSLAP